MRKDPDVRLYVLALIELARQLEAEEAAATPHHKTDAQPRGEVDL
jgi:hypothetical protein